MNNVDERLLCWQFEGVLVSGLYDGTERLHMAFREFMGHLK